MNMQQEIIDYLRPFSRSLRPHRLRNRPSLTRFIRQNWEAVIRCLERYPTEALAERALQLEYMLAFVTVFPTTIRISGRLININEAYAEVNRRRAMRAEQVRRILDEDDEDDIVERDLRDLDDM